METPHPHLLNLSPISLVTNGTQTSFAVFLTTAHHDRGLQKGSEISPKEDESEDRKMQEKGPHRLIVMVAHLSIVLDRLSSARVVDGETATRPDGPMNVAHRDTMPFSQIPVCGDANPVQ